MYVLLNVGTFCGYFNSCKYSYKNVINTLLFVANYFGISYGSFSYMVCMVIKVCVFKGAHVHGPVF